MPTGAPTLDDVKAWLGLELDDTHDDVILELSLDAALQAQALVVTYPTVDETEVFTGDLFEAVLLRTQRLAARRNSPEGVIGLSGMGGDFVSARLPPSDADITHLEGPHRLLPVS